MTGLHLGKYTVMEFSIYVANIVSSAVLDGTYQPINLELVRDIEAEPHKYSFLFHNTANLKLLSYLSDCNKMDATPYQTEFSLIDHLDGDKLTEDGYSLTSAQFEAIYYNLNYNI